MPVSLSYGESDYEIIKQELIEAVPTLTENWTDFNDSDVSTAILDLIARLNDYSSYRRDKIVRELLLPRAKERKNVKALLALVGYKMHSYISNSCEAVMQLQEPHHSYIEIPAYSQFSIESPEVGEKVKFSNLQSVTMYRGETERAMVLTQGEVMTYQFRVSDIVEGRLYLPDKQIATYSISMTTKDEISENTQQVVWEEVEDIVQVAEAGFYFSHDVNDEDEEYIDIYPIYQSALNSNSVIEIKYLVTMGTEGFVGANKVVEMQNPIYDETGEDVRGELTITNTTVAGGGSEPEDIDVAKRNAQIYVKTMDTLVTLEDYKNMIETHPTVLKCIALDWNYAVSGLDQGYIINVYVVPTEGNVVEETYKQRIIDYINPKRMTGVRVNVMEATYVEVNVGVTVYVKARSLFKDRVKNSAQAKLLEVFEQAGIEFGEPMYFSDVIAQLQEADPEIVKVDLSGITQDITPSMIEVIKLGEYDVQVMEV